ncbi:MAG: alpha-D-ribose 1-methylphosphonate 5-triphosphate diphosphatase [Pseudooceanicola sp.]|jgi:alpha-D-ribose 1-methylphosphonate 5-triphosphate diphosphatase|nr:alpha-D-ribose 1-methylphosphonate 5-triphosphate diphosphatase [Pseudooceanicola sp.]
MTALDLDFIGARVLLPGQGLARDRLSMADGRIADVPVGRVVDASGYLLLPGIVDIHGDAFERHLAPRRGAAPDMAEGVASVAAELAANGITTGIIAQFHSWEGGLRGPDHAARVFTALREAGTSYGTDMRPQLRFEIGQLEAYDTLPDWLAQWDVGYAVYNDHLPHGRLAQGKTPPRLTGQALKAGRNPEKHLAMLMDMHRRFPEVPKALDDLSARLRAQGVTLGYHDARTAPECVAMQTRGAALAEFPETPEAAQAARDLGQGVIMGAPNTVRGSSQRGNASARDMIAAGLCDALASDYHYPALRAAVFECVDVGLCTFEQGWALVSTGPARLLGLEDRGTLCPGLRADITVIDETTRRVAACFAGGSVTCMTGEFAGRIFAAP